MMSLSLTSTEVSDYPCIVLGGLAVAIPDAVDLWLPQLCSGSRTCPVPRAVHALPLLRRTGNSLVGSAAPDA